MILLPQGNRCSNPGRQSTFATNALVWGKAKSKQRYDFLCLYLSAVLSHLGLVLTPHLTVLLKAIVGRDEGLGVVAVIVVKGREDGVGTQVLVGVGQL